MSARPYARADAARARRASPARVDPSVHPLLDGRASRGRTAGRWSSSSPATRACAAASTPTSSRAPARFIAEQPAALLARPGRPQGPRLLRPPRLRRCCSSRSASSRSCSFEDAQAIAQHGDRGVHVGQGRSRDARLQRVQVGDVAAGRRRSAAADSRAPTSSAAAPAAPAAGESQIDYLYEPSPQADLRPAAAALRRGAGLPRAARVERRVLRRADDGDGHRDQELGRDDRAA